MALVSGTNDDPRNPVASLPCTFSEMHGAVLEADVVRVEKTAHGSFVKCFRHKVQRSVARPNEFEAIPREVMLAYRGSVGDSGPPGGVVARKLG